MAGEAICCDIETRAHTGCDGWNTFDDPTLEAFFLDLLGRRVSIV